jgi:uncharacterized radical SAM superfamily protein
MPRIVECFYPGDGFPAISVTGKECALRCKHCGRKYLDGMVPATRPEELVEVAEALAERGAKGFLLSGGSDSSGRVRIADFAGAVAEIKETTDLLINAHVGLSKRSELESLVRSGVDAFSTDLYGDSETISDVLGIEATPEDYYQVIRDLKVLGAPRIAPHVCIGIRGGKLGSEIRAIQNVKELEPEAVILISLMPTKGTAYEGVTPPDREALLQVARRARELMPGTKLLLGCMRSKLDRSSEVDMVEAGVNGLVLPASSTVDRLRSSGYSIKKRSTCCAMF